MTLRMHHIAPKCKLFLKKISGYTRTPFKHGGKRSGEGKGKREGTVGRVGKGMEGTREEEGRGWKE
jgi:ribosomal protein L16/L10AE